MDPIGSGRANTCGFGIQFAVRRRRETSDKDWVRHDPRDVCWQKRVVQKINFQSIDSSRHSLDSEVPAI